MNLIRIMDIDKMSEFDAKQLEIMFYICRLFPRRCHYI